MRENDQNGSNGLNDMFNSKYQITVILLELIVFSNNQTKVFEYFEL